jgi:Fe-S-cluster containining protein
MSDFDFYSHDRIKENSEQAFRRIRRVHNKIPDTRGCMENINKEGGCGAWCCLLQNPQVLYSEFLYTWKYIVKEFSVDEIINVIERAIRNYIAGDVIKGCMFFNKESRMCTVHPARPYACRYYGITPKGEFEKRLAATKKQFPDAEEGEIRDQCGLVSTLNGRKVRQKEMDKNWTTLINVEKFLGIPEKQINDGPGGSYRTYHDHVLLKNMPNEVLIELQTIRLLKNEEEKEKAVEAFMKEFRERIYGKPNKESKST